MTGATAPDNPAARLCREAAAAYGARTLASDDGIHVLFATVPGGADITVICQDDNAVLYVNQYKWFTYDWTPEDREELDDLAATIDAIQRGDVELHYRRQGQLLLHQGGRIGDHESALPPAAKAPLILRFAPWERRA
jgi:hypothetical protein